MKLKTKKSIDDRWGKIGLTHLNGLAWILGRILRRDHGLFPARVIVAAKFQGMGSLIIAKPALLLLRRAHPEARLIFWGTPATAVLAKEYPEFDEILILDDRNLFSALRSVASCLIRLWKLKVDWFLDLEPYSNVSAILSTLSCARNRAGFVVNFVRIRRNTYSHLVYLNRYGYLGEAYARLAGLLIPEKDQREAHDFGAWKFRMPPSKFAPNPYVVLNINAGDLALERRWPKEHFESLIDALLASNPSMKVILIGHGAFEEKECAGIRRRERLVDLAGKLSLSETFGVLRHAALVVSGDSAPLHMAISLDSVPVLGLYGPTRSQTYFCPWRKNAAALAVDIYCSPCVHHWNPPPCRGDNQCMKRLGVREVAEACGKLLGSPLLGEEPADHGSKSSYYPGLLYHNELW